MPTGVSVTVRSALKRIEIESKLCPLNHHDFGKWGEWNQRRWRKSQKPYWIRFRKCKRCRKTESQIKSLQPNSKAWIDQEGGIHEDLGEMCGQG